jgi:hypothetical protein
MRLVTVGVVQFHFGRTAARDAQPQCLPQMWSDLPRQSSLESPANSEMASSYRTGFQCLLTACPCINLVCHLAESKALQLSLRVAGVGDACRT